MSRSPLAGATKIVRQIFMRTTLNWDLTYLGMKCTVQILCIGTDRSQLTVQTKIRLLLKKQSDQGLRCLPFHQHLLDALMQCYIKLSIFRTIMAIVWGVPNCRIFTVGLRKWNFCIVWNSGSISLKLLEPDDKLYMTCFSRIISEMTPQICYHSYYGITTVVLSTFAEGDVLVAMLTDKWRHW